MGWTFPYGASKQSLIESLTEDEEWDRKNDTHVHRSTLARCYKGAAWKGILWAVHENVVTDKDGKEVDRQRFICCYLMQCHTLDGERTWGYKDICESMGPCYYSCPKSYLNMVPVEDYGGNEEWRKQVIEHHAEANRKRQATKAARAEARARMEGRRLVPSTRLVPGVN